MIDSAGEAGAPPATIRKHQTLVRTKWAAAIIYVRSRVSAYHRKRLVEQKVPFVVPGNRECICMLGTDLREHFRKMRSEPGLSALHPGGGDPLAPSWNGSCPDSRCASAGDSGQ